MFWRRSDDSSVTEDLRRWIAEEWIVHDAEVTEIPDWAREEAAGRRYTVHVAASPEEDFTEKLRLLGHSPVPAPLADSEPFRLVEGQ